jgi:hypothetical protein
MKPLSYVYFEILKVSALREEHLFEGVREQGAGENIWA